MSWKIIIRLSFFGLAMAFLTVFWIPTKTEPVFWVIIFIVCAYIIAKYSPGRFFLHGFLVSIVNSIWITGVHILFYDTYIINHPDMTQMNSSLPLQDSPRLLMLIIGPFFGAVSGIILGLFALIAGKFVKRSYDDYGTV
jgi:hypothetical protein